MTRIVPMWDIMCLDLQLREETGTADWSGHAAMALGLSSISLDDAFAATAYICATMIIDKNTASVGGAAGNIGCSRP